MGFLVMGILSIAALIFVSYPLINSRKHRYFLDDLLGGGQKKLNYLRSKKNLVYENIKDLELEYQMGKLSDADFQQLREGLLFEAEGIVKEIDQAEIRRDIADLIEDDVKSRRKTT